MVSVVDTAQLQTLHQIGTPQLYGGYWLLALPSFPFSKELLQTRRSLHEEEAVVAFTQLGVKDWNGGYQRWTSLPRVASLGHFGAFPPSPFASPSYSPPFSGMSPLNYVFLNTISRLASPEPSPSCCDPGELLSVRTERCNSAVCRQVTCLWCSSSVCRQVACLWLLLRYSWNGQMPLDDMNGHLSSDITTHEKMQDTLTWNSSRVAYLWPQDSCHVDNI